MTYSERGDGQGTCTQGVMTLCCDVPVPYIDCNWYAGSSAIVQSGPLTSQVWPGFCMGVCPDGMSMLAVSSKLCSVGSAAYCCYPAETSSQTLLEFEIAVENWQLFPSCSQNPTVLDKRAMDWDSALYIRQTTSQTLTGTLVGDLALLAAATAPIVEGLVSTMLTYWNTAVTQSGFPAMTMANMQSIIASNPMDDPATLINEMLCDPPSAGNAINIDQLSTPFLQSRMLYTSSSLTDHCLFYTRRAQAGMSPASLSTTAVEYACNNGLTTIWVCISLNS